MLLTRSISLVGPPVCCTAGTATAQTSQNAPRLREGLERDPEAARLYHLPTVESLESGRGLAVRKECDMLGRITRDDPPLLLDSPELVAVPTTRSHVVHSVRHARAVRSECAADGVGCVVRQDHPEPPRAADFLLARLRPMGRPAAVSK